MSNWICPAKEKTACFEDPYTCDDKKKAELRGFCPKCKLRLIAVAEEKKKEPSPEETFVLTISIARAECESENKVHYNSYVKGLLDALLAGPEYCKRDFMNEWKIGEVRKKLFHPDKRLSNSHVNCVTQAFTMAGSSLPDKCPKGEMFGFEMPYMMSLARGWTCVGNIMDAFKSVLSSMPIEADKMYLASTTAGNALSEEGHTVLMVTTANKTKYLMDFQHQDRPNAAKNVLKNKYVAWSHDVPEDWSKPNWAVVLNS